MHPADKERERVMLWNSEKKVKIYGMSAPMRKNLEEYLRTHPHCEVYSDQDKHLPPKPRSSKSKSKKAKKSKKAE